MSLQLNQLVGLWGYTQYVAPGGVYASGGTLGVTAVVVGGNSSPFVTGYPFTEGSGYGTKYSNPASATVASISLVFLTDKVGSGEVPQWVLTGRTSTPYIDAYDWTDASGFGTKLTAISGKSSNTTYMATRDDVADASQTQVVMFSTSAAGRLDAWDFNRSGSWGSKITSPSPAPANQVQGGGVSTGLDYVAYNVSASPYSEAFPFTGTWGTKVTAISGRPGATNGGNGSSFTNGDGDVIYGHSSDGSTLSDAHSWSSGWGSKRTSASQPTNIIPNTAYHQHVGKSQGETATFQGHDNNGTVKGLQAWQYTAGTGWGSNYTVAPSLPAGGGRTPSMSKLQTTVLMGSSPSPYIFAWPFDQTSGFGTKVSNPASLPPGSSNACAISSPQDGNR